MGNPLVGGALDRINHSGFYASEFPNHGGKYNDLVKLSIGILKNDGTGDSTYMHFRSFINSFSDNYTADWGDVQYVGRGDKFYNYKGFVRSISMGWTVYAQSKQELIPMYEKLNYLASSLAPDYSWGGYMRGNLARLTVGGYLYNQLGIIKSITYDIPSESTWEIGIDIDANSDHSVKELPHMIKVTGFTFIPIENKIPQIRNHFIHLKNSQKATNHYQSYPTKGTQPKQNPTLAQATAITNEAKASADEEAAAAAAAADIAAAAKAGAAALEADIAAANNLNLNAEVPTINNKDNFSITNTTTGEVVQTTRQSQNQKLQKITANEIELGKIKIRNTSGTPFGGL